MCVRWVIFENCFIRWITYDLLDECVWKLVFERLCFTKFEENFFQTNVSGNSLKVRNVAEAGFLFVMSLRPKFLSDIGQLKMSASQRSVRPAIMCHCGVIMCHCDVIMCHRDVIIGQRLSTVVVLDPQQIKVKNWIFLWTFIFVLGSLVFVLSTIFCFCGERDFIWSTFPSAIARTCVLVWRSKSLGICSFVWMRVY